MLGSFATLRCVCALGALFLLPSTAFSQYVTTTFNGTVVANAADGFSPASTGDFADPFGLYPNGPFGGNGASLVGMPFQLTITMDVSDPSSPSWDGIGIGNASNYVSGTYYGGGGPGPLTAYLTINGQTLPFDSASSLASIFNGTSADGSTSPNELSQQAFYWLPCCGYGVQYFGLYVDLTSSTGVFGADFTTPLPTLLAGTDFAIAYAAFYTYGGEYQNLGIENVNGQSFIAPAVPEPATWALTLVGFCGLGIAGYRRRKTAEAAIAA